METIHLKTVDPISQDLLRAAEHKGVQLNWERYEKLQPQDGFLRLGLSCPYGCLQGPCRIDPFGRGPDRGLCGLDREGMAAAFLLRLAVQGVLEIADGSQSDGPATKSSMTAAFIESLEKLGGSPVSMREVYQSAAMLSRPTASFEKIVQQTLRMGLFAVDRLSEESGSTKNLSCRAGYGVLAENPIAVAVCGKVTRETIESLVEAADQQTDANYQVLSLGDWIPLKDRYLPFVCSSGEAELVLSTGKIGYLLAGPGTDPGVIDACKRLEVPITEVGDTPGPQQILEAAQVYHSRHKQAAFSPDVSLVDGGRVTGSVDALKTLFERAGDRKVAIIGGSDMPHQPHGWIPVELAKALRSRDIQIAAWGDAATWMIKDGLCSDAQETPVIVLEPETGPLRAVDALQQLGKQENLVGICFSGLKECRDLSAALGLAAMGVRVNVATPIPLWGSEAVRKLLTEKLSACGGELAHYDHPAQPEEILDWFDK